MIQKRLISFFGHLFQLPCKWSQLFSLSQLDTLFTGVLRDRYPWDVYLKIEFDENEISAISTKESWSQLAKRIFVREMSHWGTKAVQIGDAGVVAATIAMHRGNFSVKSSSAPSYAVQSEAAARASDSFHHEEAVSIVTYPVTMELCGKFTRGMTVVDQRAFVVPPDIPRQPENTQVSRIDTNSQLLSTSLVALVLCRWSWMLTQMC
mgnify:FL=1